MHDTYMTPARQARHLAYAAGIIITIAALLAAFFIA